MSDRDRLDEQDLHAFLDGELDQAHRKRVEALLNVDAQAAERLEAYRKQKHGLHALFDPVLEQPVPERLRATTVRPRRAWSYGRAALIAWLVIGPVIGWFGHVWMTRSHQERTLLLPREAAIAHAVYTPEVLHPVEVTAAHEQHLVKWLSKRLGRRVRAPELERFGFNLVGGRLLPGERGPAAQFMYEDAAGKRLTLYVSARDRDSGQTAFRFAQEDGVSVFYWIDGRLGYALSGAIDRPVLLAIAEATYKQLGL